MLTHKHTLRLMSKSLDLKRRSKNIRADIVGEYENDYWLSDKKRETL